MSIFSKLLILVIVLLLIGGSSPYLFSTFLSAHESAHGHDHHISTESRGDALTMVLHHHPRGHESTGSAHHHDSKPKHVPSEQDTARHRGGELDHVVTFPIFSALTPSSVTPTSIGALLLDISSIWMVLDPSLSAESSPKLFLEIDWRPPSFVGLQTTVLII